MNKIPNYNLKSFKIIKTLGEGSFGDAYLVQNIPTSMKYVSKVSRKEIQPNHTNDAFFKELSAYSKTKNPSILPIYGYSLHDIDGNPHPSILLEYMKNGSLREHLCNKSKKSFLFRKSNQTKRYIILLGIALGMKYLHSQGIIHRDLKTDNILLDDNFYPRICDFGLSVISDLPLSQFLMNEIVGTPLYMAPEIFSDENYTNQVDVYAFSLVAYEILTGIAPFQGYRSKYALAKDIINGKRPDLSTIKDKEIQNFIKKCWSNNPCDRPEFSEIVEEILTDKYKKFFNVDKNEIIAYLNYFDENLINPNLCQQLNLKKSADAGNANSMFFYGLLRSYKNKEESNKYIRKAADRGNEKAMNLCYNEMKKRIENQQYPKESIKNLKKLIKKGNHMAMLEYGLILLKLNKFQAAHYFKLAFKKGNIIARDLYSMMLYKGDGVMCNKKEAAYHFKILAEYDFIKPMTIYGMMLYFGDGVKMNKNEAANYIKMSADKGCIISSFLYGYMLLNGDGIKENKKEARKYFLESIFGFSVCALFFYVLLEYNENKHNSSQSQMINLFQLDEIDKLKSKTAKRSIIFKQGPFMELSLTDLFKPFMDIYLSRLVKENMSFLDRIIHEITYHKGFFIPFFHFEYGPIKLKEAALFLKKMANKGNSDAMLFYGIMLLIKEDLNIGKNEDLFYLKNAASKGNNFASLFYNFIQLSENNHTECNCDDINLMLLFAMIAMCIGNKNRLKFLYKRGKECLKNLAEKGDVNSMFLYALLLINKKISQNKLKSMHYFKKAADKGHENSMFIYATMINESDGNEMNKKEKAKYFKKSADKGNTTAMLIYGKMLISGNGVKKNEKEAAKYFKKSADKGNLKAMFTYGKMLLFGNKIEKNEKEAEDYFLKSANLGFVHSMYMYAIIQYKGIGKVKRNFNEAAKYFKMAADKNDQESMYYYGNIIYKGKGVPVNKKEAIEYYRKSSYRGYTKSMYKYGRMLLNGKDIEINKEEGLEYLKRASEKGHRKAMFKYGLLLLLFERDTSKYDKKKALHYILRSSWLYIDDQLWLIGMILLIILILIAFFFCISKLISLL